MCLVRNSKNYFTISPAIESSPEIDLNWAYLLNMSAKVNTRVVL